MNLKKKNILIMGLGLSGIAVVKELSKLKASIHIWDARTSLDLKDALCEMVNIEYVNYCGQARVDLDGIDLIIKSPGIPFDNEILQEARAYNIEIINDIELAYLLGKSKNIVGITGTNGKTTTTSLVGEIFKSQFNTYIGGNIGKSILKDIIYGKEQDRIVLELSSFQLQDINKFKPKISCILNIREDHLDWHKEYSHYIEAKKNIFKNQDKMDYLILNYEDPLLKEIKDIGPKIIYFSSQRTLDQGVYLEDNQIVLYLDKEKIKLVHLDQIKVLGKHNLENIMAGILISYLMGISIDNIRASIIAFKGVEHRLEYVLEKSGIKFYNDSKGTNPESSIKAIEALEDNIVLIAGGYDKNADYSEFISKVETSVKYLVLLGATSEKIKEECIRKNYNNYILVDNLEEAVNIAYNNSSLGDKVLLSPACASWGMFKNFEERGLLFKDTVKRLGEK